LASARAELDSQVERTLRTVVAADTHQVGVALSNIGRYEQVQHLVEMLECEQQRLLELVERNDPGKGARLRFINGGQHDEIADAHNLVTELKGPFDFVFSDADKEWYTNYFMAVAPKLIVGGCFTTHNVSAGRFGRGGRGMGGQNTSYYDYVTGLPNFESTLDTRGSGLLVSFKKSNE